jgi:hypothetical protein
MYREELINGLSQKSGPDFRVEPASGDENRFFKIVSQGKVPADAGPPEIIAAGAVRLLVQALEYEVVVFMVYPFQPEIEQPFYPFYRQPRKKRGSRLPPRDFQIYLPAALPALKAPASDLIACLEDAPDDI